MVDALKQNPKLGLERYLIQSRKDSKTALSGWSFDPWVSQFLKLGGGVNTTLEYEKVDKPWGWYIVLDEGPDYVIKKIYISPLEKILITETHASGRILAYSFWLWSHKHRL